MKAALPASGDKRLLVCRVLISLLAGSSLQLVQAIITCTVICEEGRGVGLADCVRFHEAS